MPKAKPPTCGNCLHSAFTRTVTGAMLKTHGHCGLEVKIPPLPWGVTVTINRLSIWPDSGEGCPTWKPKFPGRPKETK